MICKANARHHGQKCSLRNVGGGEVEVLKEGGGALRLSWRPWLRAECLGAMLKEPDYYRECGCALVICQGHAEDSLEAGAELPPRIAGKLYNLRKRAER